MTVEIAEFKVTAAGRSHGTNYCLSSEQPESSYCPSKCRGCNEVNPTVTFVLNDSFIRR